jgi:L-lactate dehydrogenase complex protein LldG
MSARDAVLGSIRRALGRGELSSDARDACAARLAARAENLVPARARALPPEERVALFVKMAEAADATVMRVKSLKAVPGAIADYLSSLNLPPRLVASPDSALDGLPWAEQPLLEVRTGAAADGDQVGVTACFAAVAETGTLMLLSGKTRPTRNNFLPDTHIVILRSGQVVAAYEDGFAKLRAENGDGAVMPRALNFITGPSRTADIEQKIELGVHGPRRLHIVLMDDDAG